MTENERARQIAGRLVTQGRMTITQIATVCDIPEAEVLAMATNYRDRTDLLHRIRALMDDISKTQRDDAKADLICMACLYAHCLVYGSGAGTHALADIRAYIDRMCEDGGLDWLLDTLYCRGTDSELENHLQGYLDRVYAAILLSRYAAER